MSIDENKAPNSPETLPLPLVVRPTKKQRELLEFIEVFIIEHGYSPSYREIMNGVGYTSVATVALHVKNLIARGHLVKRDHSARSLEVVQQTKAPSKLLTNEVTEAEERWLVDKVEKLCKDAEAGAFADAMQLENIAIMIAALRVLGLDGAAQTFVPRLQKLQADAPKQ